MNWDALTEDERDRLVAEKVMNWQPQAECDGSIGELPISPDGWFCEKCGYNRGWGSSFTHEELPPGYTESMDKAWLVIRKLAEADYRKRDTFMEVIDVDSIGNDWDESGMTLKGLAQLTPEKICKAALIAVGIDIT